jgi:hypothetical protein
MLPLHNLNRLIGLNYKNSMCVVNCSAKFHIGCPNIDEL